MPHHENDTECPLCVLKLVTAHPYMQGWFKKKKVSYPTLHISWAFRGQIDQHEAFANGKSGLDWPKSAHNHMELKKACSFALDLFSLTEDGIAVFPQPLYIKINAENMAERLPVLWGGTFKSLGDMDHFQYLPG